MPDTHRHGHAMKLHRSYGFGEVSNAGPQQELAEDTGLQPTGTFVAVSTLALGVAANIVVTPDESERAHRERCSERTEGGTVGRGRGGPRNKANRASVSLSEKQVANVKAAVAHAERIGLPLNRMMTVHWEASGVPLEAMAKATGRFTDFLSKALTRHGSRTAWAWVHENGESKGGHCHLLLHVPPSLVGYVARRQRSWLKRITGRPYKKRSIFSRPVGGLLGLEVGNPELHAINLGAALNYLIKGVDPQLADRLGLDRVESGGRVIGKRCGTSQNIGNKARKAYNG
jgi:hypothetical protein